MLQKILSSYRMRVGIVDFSKRTKKNDSLHEALQILGHDIFVVHHSDDWYNIVYSPHFYFQLTNHYCENMGGKPRYSVNDNTQFYDNYKDNVAKLRQTCAFQAVLDRDKITKFITDYNC